MQALQSQTSETKQNEPVCFVSCLCQIFHCNNSTGNTQMLLYLHINTTMQEFLNYEYCLDEEMQYLDI